jgi:hypothetical protein
MIYTLLIIAAGLAIVAGLENWNRAEDARAELLHRRLERQRDAQRG